MISKSKQRLVMTTEVFGRFQRFIHLVIELDGGKSMFTLKKKKKKAQSSWTGPDNSGNKSEPRQ